MIFPLFGLFCRLYTHLKEQQKQNNCVTHYRSFNVHVGCFDTPQAKTGVSAKKKTPKVYQR